MSEELVAPGDATAIFMPISPTVTVGLRLGDSVEARSLSRWLTISTPSRQALRSDGWPADLVAGPTRAINVICDS